MSSAVQSKGQRQGVRGTPGDQGQVTGTASEAKKATGRVAVVQPGELEAG